MKTQGIDNIQMILALKLSVTTTLVARQTLSDHMLLNCSIAPGLLGHKQLTSHHFYDFKVVLEGYHRYFFGVKVKTVKLIGRYLMV